MEIARRLAVAAVVLFGTLANPTFAEEISLSPVDLDPPTEWARPEERAFQDPELWWLPNRREAERLLQSAQLPEDLRQELRLTLRKFDELPAAQKRLAEGMAKRGRPLQGVVMSIPRSLKARLPREWISEAYAALLPNNAGPYSLIYRDRSALEADLDRARISTGAARERLQRATYSLNGNVYLVSGAEVADIFPVSLIEEAAQRPKFWSSGYLASLTLTRQDDLAEVARKYAGGRNPIPLERELRGLLGTAEQVTVPMERILHSFIQDRVFQFADRDGPNCRNCGLSIHDGDAAKERFQSNLTAKRKLLKNFRFVQPGEPLRTGDVLAYLDPTLRITHVANYIGQGKTSSEDSGPRDFVFSKNGASRYAPYAFSDRAAMEDHYFPNQDFKLLVFRKPGPGETVASASGSISANGLVIYEEGGRNHSSSGLRPVANPESTSRAVSQDGTPPPSLLRCFLTKARSLLK